MNVKKYIEKIDAIHIKVLCILLYIMPIVDSLNGIVMDVFPIGKIYRISIFLYLVFLLYLNDRKFSVIAVASMGMFGFVQIVVGIDYWQKSVQDTVKLFLPMLMIVVIKKLCDNDYMTKKNIYKVLDFWSIVYPVMIIVPKILGIGTSAYDGITGNKGFFYAVNEISFVVSGLIMYQAYKFTKKMNKKTIVLLITNLLSIVLMGTKTGYVTGAIFSIICIVCAIKKRDRKAKLILSLWILVGMGVAFLIFKDSVLGIIHRWQFQMEVTSVSLIDFLTSQRLRRFDGALDIFWNGKWWYKIVGWGFGGELIGFPNMEMDWLDLIFRTGIVGSTLIFIFYFRYWKENCKKKILDIFIVIWAFALSFGAGHVLFYGQSGMMLAMIMIFTSYNKDKENRIA